jgi:predicted enzyme related to lactoylglutathione lyase
MSSHRSRLCAASIDVPREAYDADTRFWSGVTQRTPEVDAEDPDYSSFGTMAPGVEVFVQSVGDPAPRIHLDIETDDIEAEVARLVGLGATVVDRIHTWVVMRDPVGITFCVVRVQNAEAFDAHARTWTT